MDPRNPLGRLDRLSRDPSVRRLVLTFEREDGAGDAVKTLELETAAGRRRTIRMRDGWSWIDLLDRLQRAVEDSK